MSKIDGNSYALIAMYEYRENYGAHAWDGKGECPQHWKNKGGDEVVIAEGLTLQDIAIMGSKGIHKLIEASEYGFSKCTDYNEWWFIGYTYVRKSKALIHKCKQMVRDDMYFNIKDPYGSLSFVVGQEGVTEYEAKWAFEQMKN